MKKTLLFLTLTLLMTSGCSKTWSGIKQDSTEVYQDTKGAIHTATAPSYAPQQDNTLQELPQVKQPEVIETLNK